MSDLIEYKFLTAEYQQEFIELMSRSPTIMDVKKLDTFADWANNHANIFSRKKSKVVGAFRNNKLIASMEGYFPANFMYWYTGYHFSTPENNLSSHNKSYVMFANLTNLLIAHAEQNGYYGFYARRSLNQERKWQKIRDILISKKLVDEPRYELFVEHIYEPYDECQFKAHQFFFNGIFPFHPNPTVITLSMLKPEHRKEFFKKLYE